MKLRTIIWQELRQRKWFIFWWTVGIVAYMALVIAVYPSFRHQAAALNDSLNQLPDTVKSLVSDTGNFLSPVGYLSSNAHYLLLPLLFGVLAIGLGSSLLAKDEQAHTLELILSRPVRRSTVLFGKAVAGAAIVAGVALAASIATMILSWAVNLELSLWRVGAATMMSAFLALLFGVVAYTFTAFGRAARLASVGTATLLFAASYLFTSLAGTVRWLRWPAKLLPYNYYHPAEILGGTNNGGFTALGFAAIIAVLCVAAWVGFRRRDIA